MIAGTALTALLAALLLGASDGSSASTDEARATRIGVLAYRGETRARARWTPTADYLTRSVAGHRFEIVALDLAGISTAAASGELDFVLTNPGSYVELEARVGASRIATLRNRVRGEVSTRFGAVVFTRAGGNAIREIGDLRGRSFMAVSRDAFGGFQMAWRALREAGIDPFEDFLALHFAGFPQDQIVYAVRDGRIDAGTVRTDTLERMAEEGRIRLEDYRVLGARSTPGFSPRHSTVLYPEWPFARLRHTPGDLSQQVAVALLTLAADDPVAVAAGSAGWTIPLDYTEVHSLFRELGIGPYARRGEVSLRAVLEQYAPWLAGAGLSFLLLSVATVYVSRTNRRLAESDQALRREIAERREAQEALARHRDNLEQNVEQRTRELARVNRELECDIAARRQAEEALRRSEASLRELHDVTHAAELSSEQQIERLLDAGRRHFDLPCGVLSRIDDGRYRVGVQRGCAGLALAARPLCETPAAGLPGRERPLALNGAGPPPPGAERVGTYFATAVNVNGHTHSALEFFSGEPRRTPFTSVDVDILQLMGQWIGTSLERELSEERAAQHQAELSHVGRLSVMGEMATGLAHELNQPLTAVVNYTKGCVRRLRGETFDRQALIGAMEQAVSEAGRASDIIHHLREFVRAGESEALPVDLNEVVHVVLRLAAPLARGHGVRIEPDLAPGLVPVNANPIQLEQVILNLVKNAIEALATVAREQRVVEIATRNTRTGVLLSVRDNGPGLDAAAGARLFEPFFTSKAGGMGLGLSISRSIVEACGGSLEAGPAAGGGAEFRCELPGAGRTA